MLTKGDAIKILRDGRSADWNDLRRDHPDWRPDLSNSDLSAIDLVPDGKQAFDLSGANLCGTKLPAPDRLVVGQRRVILTDATYDLKTTVAGQQYDLGQFGARFVANGTNGPISTVRSSVFISYAVAEQAEVHAFEKWLIAKGVLVRSDVRDFIAGQQIDEEVVRVMGESDAVLFFWSKVSSQRPWVRFERQLAARMERDARRRGDTPPRVIVIVLDDTPLPKTEQNRLAIRAIGQTHEMVAEGILRSVMQARLLRATLRGQSSINPDDIDRPEYEGLRKKISTRMIEIRNRMPQPILNPREPKGHDPWPDNLDGVETKRHIVYLRSSGCRWAITLKDGKPSLLPGCLDCEHSLAGSTFGAPISSADYVAQFQEAIREAEFSSHPVLCVYNEGNFYNPEELPLDARRRILELIGNIPAIKTVILESLPEHLSDEALNETRSILGSRAIEIGIGLESSNRTIRALCVNKSYSLKDFDEAVGRVKKVAQVLAYVLLKPSFLTEREALEDAVTTARYAFEHGADVVSIEPVNLSAFNMSGALNRINRYRACWLWTVTEVVRRASAFGRVRLGGEQFAPKYYDHPFNCGKCSNRFYVAFQRFNATLDLGVLDLDCECREQWVADLAKDGGPLHQRIGIALDELEAHGGIFTGRH
jgi:radical SAM enzyme (TIGR01210 family)